MLLSSVRAEVTSSRVKCLERMFFLGFLLFVVAGGFMVQGSSQGSHYWWWVQYFMSIQCG